MRIIVDSNGYVVATGESDSLIAGVGQEAIDLADLTHEDYRAAESSVASGIPVVMYDATTQQFTGCARIATPEEEAQAATRALVVQAAQTAVGQSVATLTAAQVRALLAIVLQQAGALSPQGAIRPLEQWAGA